MVECIRAKTRKVGRNAKAVVKKIEGGGEERGRSRESVRERKKRENEGEWEVR